MHVILRQDVDKLGKAGEVVKVKDGYARNFLFPKSLAFPDGDTYMNRFKETVKSKNFKTVQAKKSDDALKRLLEGHTALIKMKVGEEGKLFGSVTSQNIADELGKNGIEIDKKRILLEENIKHLGDFKIGYKSHSETEIFINVKVEAVSE
jgi:large subunit ribosomal protein L9